MLKSAEKTGTNEYTVALHIDAGTFAEAVNKAYLKKRHNITVPGFRKGKAPRHLIEKYYGEGVFYDEALNIAFPDVYEKAIGEAEIDTVDDPRDFEVGDISKEGVDVTCKVTVKPEVGIAGYKGLSAVKAAVTVSDDDVEADLKKKQEDNAREQTVEDRKSKNGDIATIDFEGFVDGVPFEGGKKDDYDLELGSGTFIPGFEEQVENHDAGESFDVTVTFPEDYAADLAGKEAVFKVTLKAIKEKLLPELDDEFAKDVSEFDTLDELRADIRKTITEEREKSARSAFENEIYNKLADLVEAEIPECMFEKAVNNMVAEFRYNVESQGLPFEQYLTYFGMDETSLRTSYRDRAEKDVKIELALEKIAELEKVEISDEELETEYNGVAERYGMETDKVKEIVSAKAVTKELKSRKAAELVLAAAVEEEAPKAEKKPAAKKKAPAKKPAAKKKPAAEKAEAADAPAEAAPAEEAPAEEAPAAE